MGHSSGAGWKMTGSLLGVVAFVVVLWRWEELRRFFYGSIDGNVSESDWPWPFDGPCVDPTRLTSSR